MSNYKHLSRIKNPQDIKTFSIKELYELAEELRDYIVKVVSKNGGHLASSIGVVDLTLSLFHSFDFDEDKIVWDVGHQSYAYKILTGRFKEFETLRQYNGISGFPKISESKYDFFGTAHSSTSISSALGFAVARDLNKKNYKVISVIGDGGMTGGISFEGFNNLGHLDKDMIVILNDNDMFISHSVGALGSYLNKIMSNSFVINFEQKIAKITKKFRLNYPTVDRFLKRIRKILSPGILFEEFGFTYIGPLDGHDIKGLINIFETIKDIKGPILIHVLTMKGKGYLPAENEPSKFHGVGKFNVDTGIVEKFPSNKLTYTQAFSQTLLSEASKNPKIIAITAAMCDGTGLNEFSKKFSDRYFDVGIAEQHAITFAAGLAKEGMRPVCSIYSTFLQRGYDQIIHDVCVQNLPVIFAVDRAGLVGEDGATHHGVFDISFLRAIPNFVLMSPKDENELSNMLSLALTLNSPVAIRYPRGNGEGVEIRNEPIIFQKAEVIFDSSNVVVIGYGSIVSRAKNVISHLRENFDIGLINLRFVKPLDEELILSYLKKSKKIVTLEEHIIPGGMGSCVDEFSNKNNVSNGIINIGIEDFIDHGRQDLLRDVCGLSEEKLYDRFKKILEDIHE